MTNYGPGMTKKKGCFPDFGKQGLVIVLTGVILLLLRRRPRITAVLTGLALLVGLTVAAQPAEAVGYFYTCPQALQSVAYKCTYVNSTVNVLDRTTGVVVTWHNLTTVGMGFWTTDTGSLCGVNGDRYVWAVWWLDTYNIRHWAVIGDWHLWTGAPDDWGPQPANSSGTLHYSPDKKAANPGSGYCNGPAWANLGVGG